jgi:hypothetical protein
MELPKPPSKKMSIDERIKTSMTNTDLERHTGIADADIIKYSDLKNYSKLEELLPTDKSARIILIEDKYNHGHWVCVLRYGDTFEYFNSYGKKYDADWGFVGRMMRVILGQQNNDMTRLFKQAQKDGWKTTWNKVPYQKMAADVQTCGRWCVFRIETMKIGYTLDEFHSLITKLTTENGGAAPDWVVSKYVE